MKRHLTFALLASSLSWQPLATSAMVALAHTIVHAESSEKEPALRGELVSLFYFDDPLLLIQSLTGKSAETLTGVLDASAFAKARTNLQDNLSKISKNRTEVDRLNVKVRQLEEALKAPRALVQAATDQVDLAQAELVKAQALVKSFEVEKIKAEARKKAKPEDAELSQKLIEATLNYDLAVADQKQRENEKAAADAELLAAKSKATSLETQQGISNQALETAKAELTKEKGALANNQSEFTTAAIHEAREFGLLRDFGSAHFVQASSGSDCVMLVALPEARGVFLYGPTKAVSKYRAMIEQYDRPQAQATLSLWCIQLSSHSDECGVEAAEKSLEAVDTRTADARQSIENEKADFRVRVHDQIPPGDFWARLGFYDHEILEIWGIDPKELVKGAQHLEKLYPTARFTIPDPAKAHNLPELLILSTLATPEKRDKIRNASLLRTMVNANSNKGNDSLCSFLQLETKSLSSRGRQFAQAIRECAIELTIRMLLDRLRHLRSIDEEIEEALTWQEELHYGELSLATLKGEDKLEKTLAKQSELRRLKDKLWLNRSPQRADGGLYQRELTYLESLRASRLAFYFEQVEPLRLLITESLTQDGAYGGNATEEARPSKKVLSQFLGYKKNQVSFSFDSARLSRAEDGSFLFRTGPGRPNLVCSGTCFDFSSNSESDEVALGVSDHLRRLSPHGVGFPLEATVNSELRQMHRLVAEHLDSQYIRPMYTELAKEMRGYGVQVGTLEKTSILCSNRLLGKTEPSASSNFELGERQDLLAEISQLGELITASQQVNILAALNQQAERDQEHPKQVFGLTSGGRFQVRPIVDPTGENLRFRVDYSARNQVTDPDGSSRPRLNRIENHSINTEVVLNNHEIRQVSRYQNNAKLGIPEKKWGGIPILNDIPGLKELPLIGWFSREWGDAPVVQQSIILAETSVYPVLSNLIDHMTEPYRGEISFSFRNQQNPPIHKRK